MDRDYYSDDLRIMSELEELEEAEIPLVRRIKIYNVRKNPFELEEDEFKYKYRFSPTTAQFIIDMVKNDLIGDTRGGFIPPELKVLAAIRTWARGEIQDDAGDLSGMSQPTICNICRHKLPLQLSHINLIG